MLLPIGPEVDTGTTMPWLHVALLVLAPLPAEFKRRGRHCSNGCISDDDTTGGTVHVGLSASFGSSIAGRSPFGDSTLALFEAGGVIAATSVAVVLLILPYCCAPLRRPMSSRRALSRVGGDLPGGLQGWSFRLHVLY